MAQREEFVIVAAYWRPYLATENDDPDLIGCRGMGSEIGAGFPGTRTGPNFIENRLQ